MAKKDEAFCSICGMVISKYETGGVIPETEMRDYTNRETSWVEIVLCQECLAKIRGYLKGGMRAARKRTSVLQEIDR